VYNPDQTYLWKGKGVTVALNDVLDNVTQGRATEKAFMKSEYKPSIIVKVDAMADEFSTPEGRQVLIDSYMKPAQKGEPWLIPAEQFDIQQVKPLTLADLAINDSMTMDKRMIAAIFGVPAFIVGVGEYNRNEWNTFVQSKIMIMAKNIAAELTKKLIINPKWYLALNVWSLMDYDLKTVSDVLLAGSDRGFVNGDEWRDRMHMNPAGLKEYKILENYLPYDMSGLQKKLIQQGEE
jgi:HK97 family phage portal protein